ncbi:MAG: alpha/beta hydrolase, partial [Phycisphaerae bacterium]|nr:alpha/beta hydrolase [Gemmatimonadaceae bacterium]
MTSSNRARVVALLALGACTSAKNPAATAPNASKIAMEVSGTVAPTIVLQSGLGDSRDSWSPIFGRLAQSHRVFRYDRPGYGQTKSVGTSRDPCSIATELRIALGEANLHPPYVLVGHSIGGLYQFVFAKLFPDDVAGLVLLDPSHPNHWARMQQDAPAAATMLKLLKSTAFRSAARREFDDQAVCLERLDLRSPLAIPAKILTRTQYKSIELGAFETMVHALERDWVAMLGVAQLEPIDGSGHYIHKEKPT